MDMDTETPPRIPVRDLVRYDLRLGLRGFGGPGALVGQVEREMVAERKGLPPAVGESRER
jgi:chromate transporter